MLFTITAALSVALLWGLTPLLHKVVPNDGIRPQTIMVVGSVVYVVGVLSYAWYSRTIITEDLSWRMTSKDLALIVVAAFFTGLVANIIYLTVLSKEQSHVVSALIYCSPLFTLLLARSVLNERVSSKASLGVCFIVGGIILIATSQVKR
jgi:uncharacterized membrane protein